MSNNNYISLTGIRQNNLKNISIDIPHDQFIAITGVSGSGKSTLAFDTLYAEGGRRYIETFSPYTRQFLDRLPRPALDSISGVRPALALEQSKRIVNARSTVGTVTEINEYIKIIWSALSTINCPKCGSEVTRDTPTSAYQKLISQISKKELDYIAIAFPTSLSGSASLHSFKSTLLSQGFLRFFDRANNKVSAVEDLQSLETKNSELTIVLDRIKLSSKISDATTKRLMSSVHQALNCGLGQFSALIPGTKGFSELKFSSDLSCPNCKISFPPPSSSMFSFNSPLGACETCKGFGYVLKVDPARCIPNPSLSIEDGALACWEGKTRSRERKLLVEFCKSKKIPLTKPWNKLKIKQQELILEGDKKFKGLNTWFERLKRKQYKMHVRVYLSRYRGQFQCDDCKGARLKAESSLYQINGTSLPDVWAKSIERVIPFFKDLHQSCQGDEATEHALIDIVSRLEYLQEIGLGYLSLDRQSRTLSGGESQRVNLTSILGARLIKTLLVLDEPTIGLHASDTHRLISTLKKLRDRGNSLIVVEHDSDVIRAADSIIDLGPCSGSKGGEIVFQGELAEFSKEKSSLTANYLSGRKQIGSAKLKAPLKPSRTIDIKGASAHNLAKVNISIPLGCLTVLCGVSGSGKTSLIEHCLHKPFERYKYGGEISETEVVEDIIGLEQIDRLVLIDQSPVGKTPRSNPATYTKVWDLIRLCLAETEEAKTLGLAKAAFSFNVDGGRCNDCKGAGYHRIEMQFLADVFVLCQTCQGQRFQEKVLGVRYHNKNVIDFLGMTVQDVHQFFKQLGEEKGAADISRRIEPLVALGLDYLKLGHPLNVLSGGEAQRLKLASYLAEKSEGNCLFILDEPTTGLHPENISSLLEVFTKLCGLGHSLLVVEHNLDLIKAADWLIELGPGGGENGGQLIAQGAPATLLASKSLSKRSPTLKVLSSSSTRSTQKKQIKKKKTKLIESNQNIKIKGARHHNLKEIDLEIPQNKLITVSGVSGSGKSSLAFDILFAEGQRRYIDCLSPYARQYMKQIGRADLDSINLLPPTIAVSQKTAPPLGISTVATTTEIYQYLRLLFAKAGVQHCPKHNLEISSTTCLEIAEEIVSEASGKTVYLFAAAVSGRKGYYNDLFARALRAEISEARIDGKIRTISSDLRLERHKLHWISLLLGSLKGNKQNTSLISEAIEQCLLLGNGEVEVAIGAKDKDPILFNTARVCPKCKQGFRALDPQDFSFRSSRGVCQSCGGRGVFEKASNTKPCKACQGARIAPLGRFVFLEGKNIADLTSLTAPELLDFVQNSNFDPRLQPILFPILSELEHRLKIITQVGLDYLGLNRDSSSISGGEAQRLRLARTLGSPLTGVCYVLDEPTIGLHPEDQIVLNKILLKLRDSGNTVVVVEHDEDIIKNADHVIDFGPGGGKNGGEVVYTGPPAGLSSAKRSLTGQFLKLSRRAEDIEKKRSAPAPAIELTGAKANNLNRVNCSFPLGKLSVVCGVSGAGKSSLVHETLISAVIEELENSKKRKTKAQKVTKLWDKIQGLENIDRFVEINQSPIGKTSSSNPASYLGIMNDIRKLYSILPESETRGWTEKHFSFNTGAGRCELCSGKGFIKVPMSFLPDAITGCEACSGKRYNAETESILYNGISIGSLLQKTMDEALDILKNHKRIARSLCYIRDLGLGYISLGQPSYTLSGGEAQRLKIARELGAREAKNTLYVLDEPTIGLHMSDVARLIRLLKTLVEKQDNTVVVIEHNLDFISTADHIIELGEGPGENGGNIIFSGTPWELLQQKNKTPSSRAINLWLKPSKEKKLDVKMNATLSNNKQGPRRANS